MGKTIVGCEYLVAAPVVTDVSGGLPTYGTGFAIAGLASGAESVTPASGELWLDNARTYYKSKFATGTFTPVIDEMTQAAAIALLGCSMSGTKLIYNENDVPPYVGIAYYEELESDAGVLSYRAVAYPKAKAKISNKSIKTRDNTVTFQTRELQFELFSTANKDWKVEEEFATAAAAQAWCDALLNVSTQYRVDVMSTGSGISTDKDGVNYVAAGGSLVITVTGSPTVLTDNGAAFTLTDGAYTIGTIAANHEVFIGTAT